MKLRDHPLMSYRSIPNWPPVWITRTGAKVIRGEIGVLSYVKHFNEQDCRVYLVIDYESRLFVGPLRFSDQAFCLEVVTLLKGHIGRSIADIGDLDLRG